MFDRHRANLEMEQQGRTRKWVAKQLAREPETITRYLSGERPCPKDTAIAWAAIMGLPHDAFWAADAEEPKKAAS